LFGKGCLKSIPGEQHTLRELAYSFTIEHKLEGIGVDDRLRYFLAGEVAVEARAERNNVKEEAGTLSCGERARIVH
jgi:hypothetical protein